MNRTRFIHRDSARTGDGELHVLLAVLILLIVALGSASPAFGSPTKVRSEAQLKRAWENPRTRAISVERDIFLRACQRGSPIRESGRPLKLDGNGHTIRQTCFEKRLLRQDGTGFLVIKNVTLTRGGNDGPGAAVTTRGEIVIKDSEVTENLAEEPGGAIFSQRRATIIRSVITGNLANDDGGGVYARRGGIEVYDSIISNNLVDGSGGALGSTGDILVVNSHVDGNTTDGDGGAIYTDEDGDVTVINSTVDGNTADGPGGAIFTLEGDVTIINSTLNGNRADDRGGAISGEADVTVIGSTIARNAAFAHVGGGIWSRSDTFVTNSTISHNYAEGEGGGVLAAGVLGLVNSTVADNVAPVGADVGAGSRLQAFGSVIGPPDPEPVGGQIQPIGPSCRVSRPESFGYNFVADGSCGLNGPSDVVGIDPMLSVHLGEYGGIGETRMPDAGQSRRGLDPRERVQFRPVWLLARGRAAPRAVWNRSSGAGHRRPAWRQPASGRRMRRGRGRAGVGHPGRQAAVGYHGPGAPPRPQRTDDQAHGAPGETLAAMDEMHLGGAGERVRGCRPPVWLPLRRARRNRPRPSARPRLRLREPPPQSGPAEVREPQGLPGPGNRADQTRDPWDAGHGRPGEAAASARATRAGQAWGRSSVDSQTSSGERPGWKTCRSSSTSLNRAFPGCP